jgi:hypothetical protein
MTGPARSRLPTPATYRPPRYQALEYRGNSRWGYQAMRFRCKRRTGRLHSGYIHWYKLLHGCESTLTCDSNAYPDPKSFRALFLRLKQQF